MLKINRLGRELAKISNSDTKGICVFPKGDDLGVLEAQITGPEGTPYEKGVFKVMNFPTL